MTAGQYQNKQMKMQRFQEDKKDHWPQQKERLPPIMRYEMNARRRSAGIFASSRTIRQ
jgi:hypothetical protein